MLLQHADDQYAMVHHPHTTSSFSTPFQSSTSLLILVIRAYLFSSAGNFQWIYHNLLGLWTLALVCGRVLFLPRISGNIISSTKRTSFLYVA